MKHKCYISFKEEDMQYKIKIQTELDVDMIDKSLNEEINSWDDDYILRKIREDYIADSTVTIFLIGHYSAENLGRHEQRFIKRELQASLFNSSNNSRNGILGVVLPNMYEVIYQGPRECQCHQQVNVVSIDDSTTIREFSYNYFIPNNKCHYTEDERYCVLVKWDEFIMDPNISIDRAYRKRTQPISEKVKVRP